MPDKIGNYLTSGTDMSQEVYEANRPYYSSIYSSLDRARQIATNRVKQTYAENIGNIYLQGQQASASIGSSALGANYKQYLQNQLQQNINRAYDTYLNQQQQDISKATSAYDTAMSEITSGIQEAGQELGEYMDRYGTGSLLYLEDLRKQGYFQNILNQPYEDYAGKDNVGGQGFENFKNSLENSIDLREQRAYKNWLSEKGLNPEDKNVYDEHLNEYWNETKRMSEEDFNSRKKRMEVDLMKFEGLFDKNGDLDWDKVKTAIYDENGNLSLKGQDIFDYLMALDPEGFDTYQNWLSKNDKDLYEWSIQRSILNDPTNAYTAQKRLGADGVYSFVERFGGLNEKQTKEVFSNFKLNFENLESDDNLTNVQNTVQEMKNFYNLLGLSDLEIEIKGSKGTVGKLLDKLANAKNKKTFEEIWSQAQDSINKYESNKNLAIAGGVGTTAAAVLLSFIPVIGPWLGVGVAIGGGAAAGYAYEEANQNIHKTKEERGKDLQEAFNTYVLQSSAIAEEMRKKIQNK